MEMDGPINCCSEQYECKALFMAFMLKQGGFLSAENKNKKIINKDVIRQKF